MSIRDEVMRADLERALTWVDEGRQKSDELAGKAPAELVDAVALMDKTTLEKVVLYGLLRRRFGQESAT